MAALGGYRQSPVAAYTDLSQLQHGSWVTLQAFLELFGANVLNPAFYGTTTPAIAYIVAFTADGHADYSRVEEFSVIPVRFGSTSGC